jgi:phospholipid N-methyltransferase
VNGIITRKILMRHFCRSELYFYVSGPKRVKKVAKKYDKSYNHFLNQVFGQAILMLNV